MVFAVVLSLMAAVGCTTAATPSPWKLVWHDEFSGSGKLDSSRWLYDLGHGYPGGAPNWGTGEVEYNTSSTANVYQNGKGQLLIAARRDASGNWTSGRIETQKIDFKPPARGILRVDASIMLPRVSGPAAYGYWPSFFMVGGAARAVGATNWPSVGEVDIAETINDRNAVSGALHCGFYPGGPCNEHSGLSSHLRFFAGLHSSYHLYTFMLDTRSSPQQMRWYVDRKLYFTLTEAQPGMTAAAWQAATRGYYIVLNLAMGGSWPNADVGMPTPMASTVSGASMAVDYVRVFTG
jgi:beta-glucanase (GH16 family)